MQHSAIKWLHTEVNFPFIATVNSQVWCEKNAIFIVSFTLSTTNVKVTDYMHLSAVTQIVDSLI
jgi:hypothetical protein